MNPASKITVESIQQQLSNTLTSQRMAHLAHPVPSLADRLADLTNLKRFVRENKEALCEAVSQDYGHRSKHETMLAEIFPVIDGIDHIAKHLRKWMKPQRREVDRRTFWGARNFVTPQPLGIVGVIVPWNFPINLSLMPLAYIFASGNRAMVKMSENSGNLARFLIEKVPAYFDPNKLQFFEETGFVGIEFSKLPFNHLLFTGSGQTGKAVMAAASKNLCPVTLELGGKAPAIVSEDFPTKLAAERIMHVKCLNAGQICTSVDHVWIAKSKLSEFIEAAKDIVPKRYPSIASDDYTAIIDQRAFDRLVGALNAARLHGAEVIQLIPGPAFDRSSRKMAPHLVLNAPLDSELMQREIFGPILPIRTFEDITEAAWAINTGPKPLAIYPFSNQAHTIQYLIDHVMSGGVSVNDALFHVAQHDLPFGGVGESGMGQYHGREGFETFSKMRPVFYQARFSMLKFLAPPYGRFADQVLNFLMK
mgnify:FL=1